MTLVSVRRIYESLPEVQRRRADQRRKAEYELYRLNARLYNKVGHEANRRYSRRSKVRADEFYRLVSVLSENHQPSREQKNSLELSEHKRNHRELIYF